MGTSQFSSGAEGCPDGMAEKFVAEAKRSSKLLGSRSSSVAFPEVAAGDHIGSTAEGERALF